ncbi:unnamed protein product [Urochloa decumbens]|uniref:RING-type domain-containing protein n=1 Tax=Urochloa decumbens TaxID=240449 RepID=A0ABC9FUP9_9POAL
MSSPIRGRRKIRDSLQQMDAAESAPAISHGLWQGYRRVVTEHEVVVDGQTYTVEEASFEPPSYEEEVEMMSRLMQPYLTESHRSCKRAQVAACSADAMLGLQEVRAGDAPADCAAEDRLRAMPCSHAFHEDCIFRWLRVNRVCPLCRHELPTEEQDDQDDEGDYLQDQIDAHFRQFYDDESEYYRQHYGDVPSI